MGDFIKDMVTAVWNAIEILFNSFWKITLKISELIASLLKIIAKFIRSIFLGVAAIIVALGILVIAIGGAFYLIGSALGLDESENLETTRELILKAPTKWIEDSMETEEVLLEKMEVLPPVEGKSQDILSENKRVIPMDMDLE